jgi:putative membrane protein
MKTVIKLLLSAVAVVATAYILDPHVQVDSFGIAILVAAVLSLFHIFLKPILVVLTIPVTILTLGLFLLVINAALILLADWLIGGFQVEGFLWALIFSLILSVIVSILHKFVPEDD